jgi:TM2 domain-containing membrane protein YozV
MFESLEVTVEIVGGVFGLISMLLRYYLNKNSSGNTGQENTHPPQRESRVSHDNDRVYPAIALKSAGKAAFMSFFIPGTGEFYLGQTKRAVLTFVISLVLGGGSFGTLWFIIGISSSIHAYKIGSILAKGVAVSEWE